MSSNPWTLSSHRPPAGDLADPMLDYRARILRDQVEGEERAQRERAEQSSDLNTPAVRIRAWERLHRLTLPREAAHAVLSVIADATNLTLAQVREEQQRRLTPAPPPAVEPETQATAPQASGDSDARNAQTPQSDR